MWAWQGVWSWGGHGKGCGHGVGIPVTLALSSKFDILNHEVFPQYW